MKFRALRADEIECRVAQVGKTAKGAWCSLLLYKDARCDMNILDEVIGSALWQRDHKELKGNMYAGIGLYNADLKAWVWKWDCGTESYTEAEKGEASDSFKRAGFNWGIGRELYTSPKIFINLEEKEVEDNSKTGKPQLARGVHFYVAHITYSENGEKRTIDELVIKDKSGNTRFEQIDKSKKKAVEKANADFGKQLETPTFEENKAKVLKMLEDTGININVILSYFEAQSLDDMTNEELIKAQVKLEKTKAAK